VLFAAKLLSVATGIAFTFIVVRSVSQIDYGTWGTFNIIMPYFILLSTAFPFWIMRFVARDKEGAAKTGIFANMLLGIAAALVYLALLPLLVPTFDLGNYVLLFSVAAIYIIENYFVAALEACIQAQRPHFVGYGLLVGEVCKVLLAFILIIEFQFSLLGALLSIVIAFAVRIAFYIREVIAELKKKIAFDYIREWVKGSTFNIYNIIGDRIAAIIFLMLPIYGGEIAPSYYQAAIIIANVITYSTFLAYALYPKLLAENKMEDVTAAIKMVMMFAIPMTIGVLVMADSYLVIQKEVYKDATPVLMILGIDALILTVSNIYASTLYGIEKIDEKAKIPFKQVAKSRMFIAFSLPYAHSAITLPTTFYLLTNFARNQPLLATIYVTTVNTVAHFTMFIVLYALVHKAVKVKIPWKAIAKYVLASTFMAAFLFVTPHPKTIFLTIGVTVIGGIIYSAILLVIDREARTLIKTVLHETINKLKKKV
jgi:O-antigen/teichoic acid export membrane protein